MMARTKFFLFYIFLNLNYFLYADNFENNIYNNHGIVGLINTPSARFYNESSFGITIYDGNPDQKITLTSSPFDWLEASFFYTNIQGLPYPGYESQDYKDKGFNFKLRLKEQGALPALAIGINDIAGTGFYSGEYLVSSYEYGNFDFNLGFGWGNLNGKEDFKNPLTYIDDGFNNRPEEFADQGGQFQSSRYFSDEDISVFFGLAYLFNEKTILKIERDTTKTDGLIDYDQTGSSFSYGIDYKISNNFSIGVFNERDSYYSLKFLYKSNPKKEINQYRFKRPKVRESSDKFEKFRMGLQNNGIGVNKIYKSEDLVGIEVTQFAHPNLETIDQIINKAKEFSDLDEEILINYRIVDLKADQNFDENIFDENNLIYKRSKKRRFDSSSNINVRPFLAAREGFLKAAILFENNSEYLFRDNLIFTSNLKYSLWDNFEDLTIPPKNTYPAQVRSDIKDYLRGFNDGVVIGRAQIDYYKSLKTNHHIMLSAGILEEMFVGAGLEYLYSPSDKNFAIGFEVFEVQKRDYKLQFGTLDYKNTTGHINFYHRNYKFIPFDTKISMGEYLAGDIGSTIQFSRSYMNGVEYGVFATFTDVSSKQFGEGSFDKGIFFNVPIFSNFINYSWRPLTKDPGAKLTRVNTLHDLLIRFKPIN